ncbi:MAG: hypothetical protein HY817_01305 [Candidatus Abawacabacteria bacterium]|nr:hypothetical protein [Candidatus Abawacabacteria bacterium]
MSMSDLDGMHLLSAVEEVNRAVEEAVVATRDKPDAHIKALDIDTYRAAIDAFPKTAISIEGFSRFLAEMLTGIDISATYPIGTDVLLVILPCNINGLALNEAEIRSNAHIHLVSVNAVTRRTVFKNAHVAVLPMVIWDACCFRVSRPDIDDFRKQAMTAYHAWLQLIEVRSPA